MEYRVSKSNISSRRRSNKTKKKKEKPKPPVKHGKARNRKATHPGVRCAPALFHRQYALISWQTGTQKEKNAHPPPPAPIRGFAFHLGKKSVPGIRTPRIICVSYVIEKEEGNIKERVLVARNETRSACDTQLSQRSRISSWKFHWHGAVSRSQVSAISSVLEIVWKIVVECFDFSGTVGSCFVGGGNSGGSDSRCSVAPNDSQLGVSLGSACEDDVLCNRSCVQRFDVSPELDNLA